MATALDYIKAALRRINSYQSGEGMAPWDMQDALTSFNDLLDSLSTQKLHVFGTNTQSFQWVPGQNQYTIGNPSNSALGYPNITGTVSGNTITTSSVPSQLIAGTSILNASTLTDLQSLFPTGTYVTGASSTTITMSQSATGVSSGNDTIYWSVPGNFGMARPLRITGGYTRINQLDFWLDVYASQDEYNSLLYKAQPGPWPVIAWYNPTMPYGVLSVYQTPGQSGTLYLFSDTILSNLTIDQTIVMPQGYARALKWLLAKELCAEYGFPLTEAIKVNSKESLEWLKSLNALPPKRSKYDRELVTGNRPDGAWILTGGMR